MDVPGELVVIWVVMAAFAGWALNWGTKPMPEDTQLRKLRRAAGLVVLAVLFAWVGMWVVAILGGSCPPDMSSQECQR